MSTIDFISIVVSALLFGICIGAEGMAVLTRRRNR